MGTLHHLPASAAVARRRMIAPPPSTRSDAIHVDAVARLARELLDRRSPGASSGGSSRASSATPSAGSQDGRSG